MFYFYLKAILCCLVFLSLRDAPQEHRFDTILVAFSIDIRVGSWDRGLRKLHDIRTLLACRQKNSVVDYAILCRAFNLEAYIFNWITAIIFNTKR